MYFSEFFEFVLQEVTWTRCWDPVAKNFSSIISHFSQNFIKNGYLKKDPQNKKNVSIFFLGWKNKSFFVLFYGFIVLKFMWPSFRVCMYLDFANLWNSVFCWALFSKNSSVTLVFEFERAELIGYACLSIIPCGEFVMIVNTILVEFGQKPGTSLEKTSSISMRKRLYLVIKIIH